MANPSAAGENFGVKPPRVSIGAGVGRTVLDTCDNLGLMTGGCVLRTPCIVSYDHTNINFRGIPGQGVNLTVTVSVDWLIDGQSATPVDYESATAPMLFTYGAPYVVSTQPKPYNASGTPLVVFTGYNFGDPGPNNEPVPLALLLNNVSCFNLAWNIDTTGAQFNGEPSLTCNPPYRVGGGWWGGGSPAPLSADVTVCVCVCHAAVWLQVAGFKNITITVANNTRHIFDFEQVAQSVCFLGHWGNQGEYCMLCPVGGDCNGPNGRGRDPISLPQFWREEILPTDEHYLDVCPVERRERPTCPLIVACVPLYACTGNNTCETGYTDVRCSLCVKGKYYRVDGDCIKCPSNPLLLIILFVLALLGMAGAAWWMNQKKLNMGILSIGIDYFQVLAIFVKSKVEWPPGIKNYLRYLSFFSVNIDLTAPECLVPNLSYGFKWFCMQGMPLAATGLFVFLFVCKLFYKRVVKGQKKHLLSSVPALVSTVITMMYFLYLLLVRNTFDVFNCNPTVPPDPRGIEYMSAAVIPCWAPGGLHMTVRALLACLESLTLSA